MADVGPHDRHRGNRFSNRQGSETVLFLDRRLDLSGESDRGHSEYEADDHELDRKGLREEFAVPRRIRHGGRVAARGVAGS